MKFFVDTAKIEDIKKANDMGQQIRHLSQKKVERARKKF